MRRGEWLDALAGGSKGPLLAALIALSATLPGALTLPPLDRDESRFAESSAQMLETRDFIDIRFQDAPRYKKPAGIYWLQAIATRALSPGDDRRIWSYRIPSVLGAMAAAAACAWGAAAFLPPRLAFAAGAILGSSLILSTEGMIAATDAALAAAVTAAMAALARLYLGARGGTAAAGAGTRFLFWFALGASILLKGPIGPMVAGLAITALAVFDRDRGWLKRLGWGWGLILLAFMILPWAWAITIASDGAFWTGAIGGDLAPKLLSGQESHGAPPLTHALMAPLLLFPGVALLPAGAVVAVRARAEPAVRFALCWLLPSWLVFELAPTKLVHYTLPLYGALAWLMARALAAPIGMASRSVGAALLVLAGAAVAAAGPFAAARLDDQGAMPAAVLAATLAIAAAGVGALAPWRRGPGGALLASGLLAIGAHDVLAAGVAPRLTSLWLSSRAAAALAAAGYSPRLGQTGPAAVAGYAEPSLVFLLGPDTDFGTAEEAADAVAQGGGPAIVEARQEAAFQTALAEDDSSARLIGRIAGVDYSNGAHDILALYAPAAGAPSAAAGARP
ncbi:MAG TPA: phospholipid carrier-dependent glycosyltransferase [Caulobacteraceae bacterium]|nr:phospholipid carrier-dependent glycosyltransferase [Caulobacteraceae bacterium]